MSIHLPLKLGAKSKQTGDVYWVLPIESLDAGASGREHGVAEFTLNGNKPGETGGKERTDVVHVHLEFMQPGYVLMPVPETQRMPKGRPCQLLLSLKSLSRTRSVDLYIPDSAANVDFMGTLFRHLSEGPLCTPKIDHKSTFSGREWGRDAWEAYGLQDDDVVRESPPLYEEVVGPHPGRANAPAHSVAKPGYARKSPWLGPNNASMDADAGIGDVKSPLTVSKDFVADAPAEADASAMDPMQWLLSHPELWPQPKASCSLAHTEDPWESGGNRSDDVEGGNEKREEESRQQAQREDRDHLRETGEVPGYAQKHGAGLLPSPDEAEDERLRKRKAREALSDGDSNSGPPDHFVRGTRTTRERKRVAMKDGTPREQPRTPSKLSTTVEDELKPSRRFLEEGLKFSALSIFCSGPSSALFDSTQYRWFIELVLWVRTLWRRQSNFHEVYLEELGTLCQAIKTRDRRTFETTRLQCMSSFVRGERRSGSLPRGPFGCRFEDRTDYIIDFLYHHVGPGTDDFAVDELMALNHMALAWKSFGHEDCLKVQKDQEWYLRARSFDTQMCACILVALYRSSPS